MKARGNTHHVRQADVSKATDEGAAQTRQFHKQSLVLLLDHLVLVLYALQVLLHGGNLQQTAVRSPVFEVTSGHCQVCHTSLGLSH